MKDVFAGLLLVAFMVLIITAIVDSVKKAGTAESPSCSCNCLKEGN